VLLEWELPAIDLWAVFPAGGHGDHESTRVHKLRPGGDASNGGRRKPGLASAYNYAILEFLHRIVRSWVERTFFTWAGRSQFDPIGDIARPLNDLA
jgi:hypothetical protein